MLNFPSFFNAQVGGYEIEQSLRFDGSSYLSRTPSAAGTLGTWTISYWAKRGKSGFNSIFNSGSVNQQGIIYMTDSSDVFAVLGFNSTGAAKGWSAYAGTGKLRDFSGWYHVLIRAFPSSSGKSYDGVELEIYINGKETGTTIAGGSPSGGCRINDGQAKTIGYNAPDGNYFNGYIAEWHLVDGTAAAVTDFGEYDNNGVWRPIEYTGSYGTQGYYLKFDPSATNGVGHDHSGNGNNFSPTGFTTSGTGTDVMSDTPTTNWATINPLGSNASSYSEGNLKFVGDTANTSARGAICTQAVSSGKWYWEVKIDAVSGSSNVGVVKDAGLSSTSNTIIDLYYLNGAYSYAAGSGNKIEGFGSSVTSSSYGNTYTTNDIIGVALDLDNGAIYFAKNNTWQNSGDPTSGSSKTGAAFTSFSGGYAAMSCGAQNHTATFNFGQRDFAYTPPTGFKALNTSNLSAPTVKDGGDHFNTVLYTGDNLEQVITGVNFQPDWVWVKCRNQGSTNHVLQDAVRGAQKYLTSDTTVIEGTSNGTIISFDSDGFTIGAGNPAVPVNNNGDTFVAWNWKANGNGTSSNTDGSITSTVSANPSAGFSIVSYTGNGVNGATWGHGLGVAPDMVIVKRRNASYNWAVYHSGVDATAPEDYWMSLDTTNARASNTTIWGSTAPTSTTVKVGWLNETNANTGTYIAYCFAEVEGYSKFGSYTGNNSTDGPFVYCGFSVQWLMYKRSSAAEDWVIVDNSRDTYNVADAALRPNQSLPEFSNTEVLVDFTSNGFKIRSSDAKSNGSGSTYIFMALAENPFGGDGVSPATAR
jgi:hypothetical protein